MAEELRQFTLPPLTPPIRPRAVDISKYKEPAKSIQVIQKADQVRRMIFGEEKDFMRVDEKATLFMKMASFGVNGSVIPDEVLTDMAPIMTEEPGAAPGSVTMEIGKHEPYNFSAAAEHIRQYQGGIELAYPGNPTDKHIKVAVQNGTSGIVLTVIGPDDKTSQLELKKGITSLGIDTDPAHIKLATDTIGRLGMYLMDGLVAQYMVTGDLDLKKRIAILITSTTEQLEDAVKRNKITK